MYQHLIQGIRTFSVLEAGKKTVKFSWCFIRSMPSWANFPYEKFLYSIHQQNRLTNDENHHFCCSRWQNERKATPQISGNIANVQVPQLGGPEKKKTLHSGCLLSTIRWPMWFEHTVLFSFQFVSFFNSSLGTREWFDYSTAPIHITSIASLAALVMKRIKQRRIFCFRLSFTVFRCCCVSLLIKWHHSMTNQCNYALQQMLSDLLSGEIASSNAINDSTISPHTIHTHSQRFVTFLSLPYYLSMFLHSGISNTSYNGMVAFFVVVVVIFVVVQQTDTTVCMTHEENQKAVCPSVYRLNWQIKRHNMTDSYARNVQHSTAKYTHHTRQIEKTTAIMKINRILLARAYTIPITLTSFCSINFRIGHLLSNYCVRAILLNYSRFLFVFVCVYILYSLQRNG